MIQVAARFWGVPGVSKASESETELRKIRINNDRTLGDMLHAIVGAAEGLTLGSSVGLTEGP